MKKLLSFILAAVMLMSIAPLALAREVAPAGQISKIEIKNADVIPTTGRTVGSMRPGTLYADGSASIIRFTVNNSYWIDVTHGRTMNNEDVFEEDAVYYYKWSFSLISGYTVSNDVTVLINGSDADYDSTYSHPESGYIYTWNTTCVTDNMLHAVEITDVDICPEAGVQAGDFLGANVLIDGGTNFTLIDTYWVKHTYGDNFDLMHNSDVFEAGENYKRCFKFAAPDGYSFDENTWATIDDEPASQTSFIDPERTIFCCWSDYYEAQYSPIITKINLSGYGYPPVAGESPADSCFEVEPTSAPYYVNQYTWYCDSTGEYIGSSDTFEAGLKYSVEIILTAKSGFEFADDVTVYYNGSEEYVDYDNFGTNYYTCEVWLLPYEVEENEPITSVEITDANLKPYPNETAVPSGDIEEGSPYTMVGSYWCDEYDNVYSNGYEPFEYGESYSLQFDLEAADGYSFMGVPEITINGSSDVIDTSKTLILNSGERLHFQTVLLICTYDQPITIVEITGENVKPFPDTTAAPSGTVPEDANYEIYNCSWYDENDNIEYDFEEGKSYYLHYEIHADWGYGFNGVPTVTINGSTSMIDTSETYVSSGSYLHVQTVLIPCTAESGTLIENVDISDVRFPAVIGRQAGDMSTASLADSTYYAIDSCGWFDNTDSRWMYDDDVFTAGHSYTFGITIDSVYGYVFDEALTYITINGGTEIFDIAYVYNEGRELSVWTKSVEATESTDEIITNVDITDVQFPPVQGRTAGEMNTVSFVDSSHFTVERYGWYDINLDDWMGKNDVFKAGHKYVFGVILKANSGYLFEDTTAVTINGGTEILDCALTFSSGTEFDIWTKPVEAEDALPVVLIDEINIMGIQYKPIPGDKAGDYLTAQPAEGSHFIVVDTWWFNDDTLKVMDKDDVFEVGFRYSFGIQLKADTGCEFCEHPTFTINGGALKADLEYSEISHNDPTIFYIYVEPFEMIDPSLVTIGDLNGDGKVNTADAVVILKASAGMITLDETQLLAGDTNHDGKVNTADAVLILKYAAGMITEL